MVSAVSEQATKPPAFPPWPKGLDLTSLPSLSVEARAAMSMTQQAFQIFTSWAESVLTAPSASEEEFERVVALFVPFDAHARRLLRAFAAHAYGTGPEADLLQAAAVLESFVWSYVPPQPTERG